MEKGRGKGTDTLQTDNFSTHKEYIERSDALKVIETANSMVSSLLEATMKLCVTMDRIAAADVVARDCFDKILAENDDMRAIIDTYGGLENIQSAFVKLHEIETADVAPVVRCKDCKYSAVDYENMRYCKLVTYYNHVPGDWFCADGERKDGGANVQNWEKNHLRPTNMSGTKCEPCKPTQPECGDCEYIKDGDEE